MICKRYREVDSLYLRLWMFPESSYSLSRHSKAKSQEPIRLTDSLKLATYE